MPPFSLGEIEPTDDNIRRLWWRGGFPSSFLARSDAASFQWREAFIKTYLQRDLPALGIRVPGVALERFWQMVAHSHGQLWNNSKIAAGLGVSAPTVRHYLDILQETFVARSLQPYHANIKKRLVKAPKVYLRDSGILHALLGIETLDDLFGHPTVGHSWEGWIIEQILALAPPSWEPWYYRTAAGAEIDLVLERPGRRPPLAFEIRFASDPTPTRGFCSALEDLGNPEAYVVCPAQERYPLGKSVYVLPARDLPSSVAQRVDAVRIRK